MGNRLYLAAIKRDYDSVVIRELRAAKNFIPLLWFGLFRPADLKTIKAPPLKNKHRAKIPPLKLLRKPLELAKSNLHEFSESLCAVEKLQEHVRRQTDMLTSELTDLNFETIKLEFNELEGLVGDKDAHRWLENGLNFANQVCLKGAHAALADRQIVPELMELSNIDFPQWQSDNWAYSLIGERWTNADTNMNLIDFEKTERPPTEAELENQENENYNQALKLYQDGSYKDVERLCMLSLDANPHNCDALFLHALVLRQKGDARRAVAKLYAVLKQEPNRVDAHQELASTYLEVKEFDFAEKHSAQACALAPRHGQSHHLHSLALEGLNKLDDAVAAITQAIELQPDNRSFYQTRSRLCERVGLKEQAQADRKRL